VHATARIDGAILGEHDGACHVLPSLAIPSPAISALPSGASRPPSREVYVVKADTNDLAKASVGTAC
jgi:hypothetical protein